MNLFIVILVGLVATTLETCCEARKDHSNSKQALTEINQKDIIPGGVYESESYSTQSDHEVGLGYDDNQKYVEQASLDRSNKKELTNRQVRYFFENGNIRNYGGYRDIIDSAKIETENGLELEKYNSLNSVSESYRGDSGIFPDRTAPGLSSGKTTLRTIGKPVPLPQPHPIVFKRLVPVPVPPRFLVSVPHPVHVTVPQAVRKLTPYQVYRQPYAVQVPVQVPDAVPVQIPIRRPYQVEIPQPVTVGFTQPMLTNVPQLHVRPGYGDGVTFDETFRKIPPNVRAAISTGNKRAFPNSLVSYDIGAGSENVKSVNYINLRRSQKPLHKTNLRKNHSYSTYEAPTASSISKRYRGSRTILYGIKPNEDKKFLSNTYKTVHGNENIGSRYSFTTFHTQSKPTDNWNRKKHFYGFEAPSRYCTCVQHGKNINRP